jgi:hypothetical protein
MATVTQNVTNSGSVTITTVGQLWPRGGATLTVPATGQLWPRGTLIR